MFLADQILSGKEIPQMYTPAKQYSKIKFLFSASFWSIESVESLDHFISRKANMKKHLLPLVFLFGVTPLALGDPIGIGILFGANMANQNISGSDVIFGLRSGIFVDVPILVFLSFEPEAEYSMEGSKLNFDHIMVSGPGVPYGSYTNATYTFSYNYLEMPLLVKLHTPSSESVVVSFSAGPAFGFLLNANENYSLSYASTSGNVALQGAGVVGELQLGVGLEVSRILFDLSYDLGLTSVSPISYRNAENSVLSFQIGYRIE